MRPSMAKWTASSTMSSWWAAPKAVGREGSMVTRTLVSGMPTQNGAKPVSVSGKIFVDATYEGDLFALAKVPYRVGREARDEFHEPHAGVVFCNIDKGPAPRDAV